MQGFDSEFTNLKDYILKITHRIWEERGIDRIRDYYAEHAPVKTPSSIILIVSLKDKSLDF